MEKQQDGSEQSRMSRRNFIGGVAAAAVGASVASKAHAAPKPGKFKLKYAPSFGSFKASAGNDPIDQLKFMSDQGFLAMFDKREHLAELEATLLSGRSQALELTPVGVAPDGCLADADKGSGFLEADYRVQ